MSKKYTSLAETIVSKVGGPENVNAVRHCQTRLRFTLKDAKKADKEGIQNLEGVAQVVESGGMFQVVIGMHVAEVFEEVEKFIPNKEAGQEAEKGEKMSPIKVLGKTIGIEPTDGVIHAPFDGNIVQVSDTGHAIGLVSTDGLELMIHVGVDTVEMGGVGFNVKTKVGETVKAGQELLAFDRKAIANAGHPDVVMVIVLNEDMYSSFEIVPEGKVSAGTKVIQAVK